MGNRNLNILLIGESGHGKSEFIRSLLDQSGQFIDSTGDKQTTRTSMLYRINAKDEERKIVISFRDKDSFCESRMARLIEGLEQSEIDEIYKYNLMDSFKNQWVLKDDAYFHINEFQKVKEELKNAYNKCIGEGNEERENYENLSKMLIEKNQDSVEEPNDQNDAKKSEDCWNEFFNRAYDLCFEEICNKAHDTGLIKSKDSNISKIEITFGNDGVIHDVKSDKEEEVKTFLTKCFRVLNPNNDNKRESFSSMVKRIDVICPASDELKEMLVENDLDSLTMVDTYGINHEGEDVPEEPLRRRLVSLMDEFSDEKDEISINGFDYALYVNKFDNNPNNFASQLNKYVPALVAARSSVMCYVILTGSDIPLPDGDIEQLNNEKYLDFVKDNPAYKILHDPESPVYTGTKAKKSGIIMRLSKQNISDSIIQSRIQAMVDYLTLYCAKFGPMEKEAPEKYRFLKQQNSVGLSRLLFAMKQRIHLGGAYVSRKEIENENWKQILNINEILNSEQINENECDQVLRRKYIHHSIIYALARRYGKGIIGYHSPAIGPVGYLNSKADCSILRTPLANSFTSGLRMMDEVPDFLDSPEKLSIICEVMNSHLDELLCREKRGKMESSVCDRCHSKDTCLSYQLYLLSGLDKDEAHEGKYTDLRERWKDKYLNLNTILCDAAKNQKLKLLQECVTVWFEEIIKDDILNEYNPARLAIILNAQKEDDINGEMLKDKTEEYIECIYGKEYTEEDCSEALSMIKEKVLPKLSSDKWFSKIQATG